jgi:hypothetical protein
MKTKKVDHKKFKIGEMVNVRWRKENWYSGKYYGWARYEKRHMVRFPIHGVRGIKLQTLFVKDGDNIHRQ